MSSDLERGRKPGKRDSVNGAESELEVLQNFFLRRLRRFTTLAVALTARRADFLNSGHSEEVLEVMDKLAARAGYSAYVDCIDLGKKEEAGAILSASRPQTPQAPK